MPLIIYDFHENRCSESHTLLNAAYEIWPEFSTFFPSELKKKIITENVHKSIYCIVSFVKIVTMKSILRT